MPLSLTFLNAYCRRRRRHSHPHSPSPPPVLYPPLPLPPLSPPHHHYITRRLLGLMTCFRSR